MKTRKDVWNFICEHNYGRDYLHYYVKPYPADYDRFWDTMLTTLEMCGKIDSETSWNIWNEVRRAKEA